jgi:SAM-dependent methyltransferase
MATEPMLASAARRLSAVDGAVDRKSAIYLDSNENPLGPCAAARQAIAEITPSGGRYLDDLSEQLVKLFAQQEGLKADYVRLYAGSSEPLHYTVLAFTSPSRSYVTADPGFEAGIFMSRISGARVVAVEPAAQAIRDGRASFPFVTFVRGTAHAVPLQERFDLVIVNFVFHWIDRAYLLRSVAEVDRLVADGGYLIVGDFYPSNRLCVPHHDRISELIYLYKQNYADVFLASGLYHLAGLLSGSQATQTLAARVAESERIGAWLLRKESRQHYLSFGVSSHGG